MPARRPRTTITGPLLRGNGELHVVGRRDVLTIADPDGIVQHLLGLADGSRGVDEIHAALAIHFPLLGEDALDATIAELEAIGLLEDCAARAEAVAAPVPVAGRGTSRRPLERMPFTRSMGTR